MKTKRSPAAIRPYMGTYQETIFDIMPIYGLFVESPMPSNTI
jgi:hypothetical protein